MNSHLEWLWVSWCRPTQWRWAPRVRSAAPWAARLARRSAPRCQSSCPQGCRAPPPRGPRPGPESLSGAGAWGSQAGSSCQAAPPDPPFWRPGKQNCETLTFRLADEVWLNGVCRSLTLFEVPQRPLHLLACFEHLFTFREPSDTPLATGAGAEPSPPPPTSSTERELKNFCFPR